MAVSLTVNYTQNSQNVANNTSNITVNAVVKWTGGSYNRVGNCPGSITIGGTKYDFSGITFNDNGTSTGTKKIMTKTVDVSHNDDGTKSLTISASFDTRISYGTVRASDSITLDTIPRKSTMTVGNGTLGTAQTLKVSRKSTSFTHSIKVVFGVAGINPPEYIKADGTVTGADEVKHSATSISFTPPLEWAKHETVGTSVSATYTITTYNGNTKIGSESYSKTFAIPASVKPACTITVTDPTECASNYGGYVKGVSKFHVSIDPEEAHSSSIKSYSATANGCGYNESDFTTDVLKSHGQLTVSASVTDMRGRTSNTESITLTVYDYAKPAITRLAAARCNADGTANDRGEYLRVTFTYTANNLSGKNPVSCTLKYKQSTESVYVTASGFDPTKGSYVFKASDVDVAYDIMLTVSDDFDTVSRVATGPTGFTLMHWNADGNAMGIGKVVPSNKSRILDVGVNTHFDELVTLANAKSIMGTMDDGTECSALIPVTNYNNTSLGYGLYDKGVGATQIYGNEVNFYTKNGIYTNGNKVVMNAESAIFGRSTDGSTERNAFIPVSENGNVVIGYDNNRYRDGSTNLYGHDIYFYVSSTSDASYYYRPYRRGRLYTSAGPDLGTSGDSIEFTVRTTGYVTEGKAKVEFYLSLASPVIGSPTVSISSTAGGVILRQNDKYTHGSGWANNGYSYATPTSITATLTMFCGVMVVLTFSDTTNAVNNSPIGIQWPCKITFT